MRKTAITLVMLLFVVASIISAQSFRDARKSEENTKWISDSLREMKTIEVGNTRADLIKVFTTEGGLSTGLRQTYVYRNCPFMDSSDPTCLSSSTSRSITAASG